MAASAGRLENNLRWIIKYDNLHLYHTDVTRLILGGELRKMLEGEPHAHVVKEVGYITMYYVYLGAGDNQDKLIAGFEEADRDIAYEVATSINLLVQSVVVSSLMKITGLLPPVEEKLIKDLANRVASESVG